MINLIIKKSNGSKRVGDLNQIRKKWYKLEHVYLLYKF